MTEKRSLSSSFIEYMKRYDRFGRTMPGFNLKGRDQVKTAEGSVMSIIIVVIVDILIINKIIMITLFR